MAIQWSGLGPELLLRLDRGSGRPLRSQLEEGLREAIRSGRLQGGERLPSSRELTSQIGSATRVAVGAYPAAAEPPARREPPPPRLIADFRIGVPDLAIARSG